MSYPQLSYRVPPSDRQPNWNMVIIRSLIRNERHLSIVMIFQDISILQRLQGY